MPRCPSCAHDRPADARFCPACGAEHSSLADLATQAPEAVSAMQTRPPSASTPRSHGLASDELAPGAMLLERYRVVAPIGRGGMGEVYRADDLKLGQPVALKFLPEADADRREALDLLLSEVRVARQLAHPNICRVYDVGEADGRHFISMELVDGEDLQSLLRRIGRLPPDKALQIARELCAGLAAAHDREVLHRDLKPANVMIDGRGHVRVTDFGLAGFIDELEGQETRAGTPTYMAPEQFQGGGASRQSDIYALGLVLFELFTGKPAIEAKSLQELMRLHQSGSVKTPSSVLPDIDPAVDATILRCLDPDPAQRPESALVVAASLPGGDPLAAALAAGETPSPELVAAAGKSEGMSPRAALACLVVTLGLLVGLSLDGRHRLSGYISKPRSPEVLAERARAVLDAIGHDAPVVDRAWGFQTDLDYLRWIRDEDPSPGRWKRLGERPHPLQFYYRQSPRHMVPESIAGSFTVTPTDPPATVGGMVTVLLDADGHLRGLRRVPPQVVEATTAAAATDWSPLFEAADLDREALRPSTPTWVPPSYADERAAWTTTLGSDGDEVRVEAGSHRGVPVYFELIGPWTRPARDQAAPVSAGAQAAQWGSLALLIGLLIGGALLARRNLRLGRGDRAGAKRLAGFSFVVMLAAFVLTTDHVPTAAEWTLFSAGLANATFTAALLWMFYVALEPTVRRRWPERLVGWSRFLAGHVRDPLVASDVLLGCTVGVLSHALLVSRYHLVPLLGGATPRPRALGTGLDGIATEIGALLGLSWNALFNAVILLVLLVLARLVLRRQSLANIAFVLIFTALIAAAMGQNPLLGATIGLLLSAGWLLVLSRSGLLAFAAMRLSFDAINRSLPVLDASSWYSATVVIAPLLVAIMASWAFWTSLGGRPLLQIDD